MLETTVELIHCPYGEDRKRALYMLTFYDFSSCLSPGMSSYYQTHIQLNSTVDGADV